MTCITCGEPITSCLPCVGHNRKCPWDGYIHTETETHNCRGQMQTMARPAEWAPEAVEYQPELF